MKIAQIIILFLVLILNLVGCSKSSPTSAISPTSEPALPPTAAPAAQFLNDAQVLSQPYSVEVGQDIDAQFQRLETAAKALSVAAEPLNLVAYFENGIVFAEIVNGVAEYEGEVHPEGNRLMLSTVPGHEEGLLFFSLAAVETETGLRPKSFGIDGETGRPVGYDADSNVVVRVNGSGKWTPDLSEAGANQWLEAFGMDPTAHGLPTWDGERGGN